MHLSVSSTSAGILPIMLAQGGFHPHALSLRLLRANGMTSGIAIALTEGESVPHRWLIENFGRRLRTYRSLAVRKDCSEKACDAYDVEPFVLGSRDANFELSRPSSSLVGKRRIDSLLTKTEELKVLYLRTELREIEDVLAGATRTLSQSSPVLMFDIKGSIDIKRLFEIVSGIGYDLYDTCLCSVSIMRSAGLRNIDRCFVALPCDMNAKLQLLRALFPIACSPIEELHWDDTVGTAIMQEAKQGGVQIEAGPVEKSVYEMYELSCDGFHPTEFYDGMSWRWLGPQPSGTIYLPAPRPGRYRLEISLVALADGISADDVRIFVDGTRQTVHSENYEYGGRLSIVLSTSHTAESLRLLICGSTARRASEYDPRLVCMSISRISIHRM